MWHDLLDEDRALAKLELLHLARRLEVRARREDALIFHRITGEPCEVGLCTGMPDATSADLMR